MLSIVTLVPSSTEVSATPALPASSENAIEKVMAPSLSESEVETTQVQALPDPSVTVTVLSMVLPPPSLMVQVGVPIASVAVKLRVTSSPLFASPVPAVEILTEPRVGWVLSMVTVPDPDVTAVPALPLASLKAIE